MRAWRVAARKHVRALAAPDLGPHRARIYGPAGPLGESRSISGDLCRGRALRRAARRRSVGGAGAGRRGGGAGVRAPCGVRVRRGPDPDLQQDAAGLSEFDRVVEHIEQDLLQALRVADEHARHALRHVVRHLPPRSAPSSHRHAPASWEDMTAAMTALPGKRSKAVQEPASTESADVCPKWWAHAPQERQHAWRP